MNVMKKTFTLCLTLMALTACGQSASTSAEAPKTQDTASAGQVIQENKKATLLVWEDLMPTGEDAILAELYSEFYEDMESKMRRQITLADAAREERGVEENKIDKNVNLTDIISEGSAQDTMEQIGTFNVVESLDGEKIRLPGYIVPLDFSAKSEHEEFLLVPYFGACLHTPPPPPNQIIFVKASPAATIPDINEPVWLEGTMKTGKFTSDLGNSAYELKLSKLEPYEY